MASAERASSLNRVPLEVLAFDWRNRPFGRSTRVGTLLLLEEGKAMKFLLAMLAVFTPVLVEAQPSTRPSTQASALGPRDFVRRITVDGLDRSYLSTIRRPVKMPRCRRAWCSSTTVR